MKWAPRDTAHQLQRLTRYSSMVQFSKYGLIGVAALLVLMVFLVPVLHNGESGARLVFTNVESGNFIKPRMNNPRLQGLDKNDQPYTITAKMAERQENGEVMLTKLQADVEMSSGAWLAILADKGMFNSDKNTLQLSGMVQVFHNAGYDMRTTSVFLDLDTSSAKGNSRVNGQGPLGTIEASGFTVEDGGQNIRFAPDVTVTLQPKRN